MSREQGPREAGMRLRRIPAGRRRHHLSVLFGLMEAARMSREPGPHRKWGCEREQGAGAPRAARGCDRGESLAATGMKYVCTGDNVVIRNMIVPGNAGGDRGEFPPAADNGGG